MYDNPRAIAQLDHTLDALLANPAPPDPVITSTDDIVHVIERLATIASRAEPTPDPAFVRHLKEDLLAASFPSTVLQSSHVTSSQPVTAGRGHHPGHPPRSQTAVPIARWIVILFLVIAVAAAWRERGGHEQEPVMLMAPTLSPVATDPAAAMSVPIACAPVTDMKTTTAEAVTDTITTETIMSWPTGGDRPAIAGWPMLLPNELPLSLGAPSIAADTATLTAINANLAELATCIDQGNLEGTRRFLSGDYLVRLEGQGMAESGRVDMASPRNLVPTGIRTQEPVAGLVASDAWSLADGRIAARVLPQGSGPASELHYLLFIFVQHDHRWLVDEALPVGEYPMTDEIVVDDTGFSPSTISIPAQSSKNMVLVITNEGTTDHSVVIPQWGVQETIEAGATRSITVQLRSGVFTVLSDQPGDVAAGLTGTLIVEPGLTPEESPVPPMWDEDADAGREWVIIGDDPVNVLTQPGAAGIAIAALPPGQVVRVVSETDGGTATIGDQPWLLVELPDGMVGWIPAVTATSVANG